LAGAVGVGRSGVYAWETFTVIQEISQLPGVARVGIDFLRIGRAADMPHEASSPTLTQRHILGVANADAVVAAGTPTFPGISDSLISPVNAVCVSEIEIEAAFLSIEYDIEVAFDLEGMPFAGFLADRVDMSPTPNLGVANATTDCQVGTINLSVGYIFAAATAIMPFLAGNSGFGRVQNVANAQTTYGVGAPPRMNKIIIPDSPVWSNQATTNSTQRLYVLSAANSTQGHIALSSGVSPAKINTALASNGFTATPPGVTLLARTFPHESTTGMLVSPPTMSQNVAGEPQFFGSQVGASEIGFLQIGNAGSHPNANDVAVGFRANQTATVSAISVPTLAGTGFFLGAGVFEMRILRDDGSTSHLPVDSQRTSFTVAGSEVIHTGTSAHVGAASNRITISAAVASATQRFTWSSGKPVLTRNIIYHAEIRNVHATPNNNYASLAVLQTSPNTEPRVLENDFGMSRRNTTGIWSSRSTSGYPMLAIYYDGDSHHGISYKDAPLTPNLQISGPLNKVREKFLSPNQNLRVHSIGYRLGKSQGSSPVIVRLRREGDGTVLASAAAHSSYWPLIADIADPRDEHRWHRSTFASSFAVSAGVTAVVEFETTSLSEYRALTIAADPTLPVSGQFWQGNAEFTNNGGTSWTIAGAANTHDLMFYLRTGSAAPVPDCSADTIATALTIGQLYTVTATEILLNDENPAGEAATSALPLGENQLTLHLANSASNCTATLVTASQTIRVTALATTGGFTYVAQDIFNQKSSARVTFTAISPASASNPPVTATPTTLQGILDTADPGDIIDLASGTYSAIYSVTRSGTSTSKIQMRAAAGATVSFTGVINLSGSWWIIGAQGRTTIFNNGQVSIFGDNNRVTRCRFTGHNRHAINFQNGAAFNRISFCEFHDFNAGTGVVSAFRFTVADNSTTTIGNRIDHNYCHDFSNNGQNGQELATFGNSFGQVGTSLGDTQFDHNLVNNFQSDAEILKVTCDDVIIEANTFTNCNGYVSNRNGARNQYLSNWHENINSLRILSDDVVIKGNRFVGGNCNLKLLCGDMLYPDLAANGAGGTQGRPACRRALVVGNVIDQSNISDIQVGYAGEFPINAQDNVLEANTGATVQLYSPGQTGTIQRSTTTHPFTPAVKLTTADVGLNAPES
jgi:hypothetical protein